VTRVTEGSPGFRAGKSPAFLVFRGQERVTPLAMMQAKPELRDVDSVLIAIKRSQTPFEQYQALLLAEMMLDDLDADDKQRLVEVVKSVQGRRLRRDIDRWLLSERILRRANKPRDDDF
jgi:hypothetical protein